MKRIRLGTEYGGWVVDIDGIKPGDVILDLGLGEDISFTEELVKIRDVTVVGVDPTEKSHRYVESLASSPLMLVKKAIAKHGVKTMRMYKNSNPSYVSESFLPGHEYASREYYEAECVSITDLRAEYDNISVVKMDIEGSEYDVLPECIGIPQICVEFHHFCIIDIGIDKTQKCIRMLSDNGYDIIDENIHKTEYTFKLRH